MSGFAETGFYNHANPLEYGTFDDTKMHGKTTREAL